MKKNKKEKDYIIFTLCFQCVICTLIFGVLFFIRDSDNKFFNTVSEEYFNEIDKEFGIVSEYKPDGIKPTERVVDVYNDTTVDYTNTSSELLSAEVGVGGGNDYGIDSIDDIPSNVSVNGYTLNKDMYVPLEGTITSEFGSRIHPVSGELSFHAGVDIAGDTGEPIYSAFDGEVIVADYDQWNGYYLKIIHDGNIMTVYCHCNKLYVECGDLVKAGDIIAEVGSTGTSTGPHLHFEFRIDNVSYDPKIALEIAKNEV